MAKANKTYLRAYFSLLGFLLCALLFFTLGVDPFSSFHQIAIPKVNAIKTSAHENMRLYKANRLLQEKPRSIILGSSRVMAGIDPEDLAAITGCPSYNCGFGAATFEEIYKFFLHALEIQPNLKTVVVGLDFFSFNVFEKSKEDLPKFLHGSSPLIIERLPALFSFSAFKAGFQTFKYNFFYNPANTFFRNGLFNPDIAGSSELNPIMPNELGYIQAIHHGGMYRDFKIDTKAIEKYAAFAGKCRELNIDLKVFINPAQAIYWEAMFQHGFWPEMESLKQQLAEIHPLWDFSGFNAVTAQDGNCSENLLYYECSHFRPLLGKVILDILFNKNGSPIHFGYFLNPETIHESFLAMRKEREFWAAANPELIAKLRNEDETHLVTK